MTTFSVSLTNLTVSYLSHMIVATTVRKRTNTGTSTTLTAETH